MRSGSSKRRADRCFADKAWKKPSYSYLPMGKEWNLFRKRIRIFSCETLSFSLTYSVCFFHRHMGLEAYQIHIFIFCNTKTGTTERSRFCHLYTFSPNYHITICSSPPTLIIQHLVVECNKNFQISGSRPFPVTNVIE